MLSSHEKRTPFLKAGCSPTSIFMLYRYQGPICQIIRVFFPNQQEVVGQDQGAVQGRHHARSDIVMHGEEGKRTTFFLFPTLYSISGILISLDFLFVFLLCKRRTFRQAITHWKRIGTGSGMFLYNYPYQPVQKNSCGLTYQAVHPSTLETAQHR